MNLLIRFCLATLFLLSSVAGANELVLKSVAEGVWAIVGPLDNRSPQNLGNNATFGLVETDAGLVLIDSGGSYRGAQKIHQVVKSVSDKPIKYVINSGGQDHRWFGNDYFSALGATIVSSESARRDHEHRLVDQIGRVSNLIGDENFAGTREKYADILFETNHVLEFGGVRFELVHAGQAHTPGDSFIWLPDFSVMFSGDIVYVDRMLGVGEQSNSKSWVEVFETMAAYKPEIVVPGHGDPVPLATAEQDTYRYLVTLRMRVATFLDEGGDASEISQVDMSEYEYLANFDSLNGRNALKVYSEIEWE